MTLLIFVYYFRSRDGKDGKNKLHNISNSSCWDISTDKSMNKTWAELLDEEDEMEEQNFKISMLANDDVVGIVKTEVQEMNVPVSNNVVSNVKESKADLNVKEEPEDQEDEEARLQKELDIFEHDWVRELKHEQLKENREKETSVTHVSTIIEQEKDNTTKETYTVGISSEENSANIKVKSESPEQTSEELDADKQINKESDCNCSAVECRDEGHSKKKKSAVCPETKEEKLHSLESDDVNISKFKERSRKRGRNDNIPEAVPQRYVF
jgi:hypothetical protein